MKKVVDLIVLCRIKANQNGTMMKKERSNGKVVVLIEALILIKEEVIIIVEVDFMVIVLDVAKKGMHLFNVDILKVSGIIEML